MLEYMENISQSEAENIRKTIQDLFRQTCILQTKCDPVTLIQKDNPHYQVCARNREFIADYLQVLDCELVHDPQEHIFRITGDGVLTERMTLLTTKLVILMKLIYRDKIMGEGLHATTTSLAEIRRYGKETNLITRRLTAQEWQEALILMKTHQMIELPSAIGNLEDDSPIYIYSTINIFCSAADINELVEMFKGETGETEEQKDETRWTFRNENLLNQHYEKHGIDMGFSSAEEYEDAASAVVNNPSALHKTEAEDGDDVYYVESTNEFVIVSTDGYIRTYFNPDAGIDYYNRQ